MPAASIVIVTRNRKTVAQRAIESALSQQGDIEVLVVDDASTDGTCEFLRGRFSDPRLSVHRMETREGLIVQRNRGARLATAPIIFSIDDDAVFNDANVVSEVLRLFEHPGVGALLIPFHNCGPGDSQQLMTPVAPDDGKVYVTAAFIGTAYALRRDVFLQLGGFQGLLFHWAEETEFCQRLVGAGYVVRLGTRPCIRHFPGLVAGKYSRKVNRYLWRNHLLTLWLNAPLRYLLIYWPGLLARDLVHVLKRPSRFLEAAEGIAMAHVAALCGWRLRKPISASAYALWKTLRGQMVEFDQISSRLPPRRQNPPQIECGS